METVKDHILKYLPPSQYLHLTDFIYITKNILCVFGCRALSHFNFYVISSIIIKLGLPTIGFDCPITLQKVISIHITKSQSTNNFCLNIKHQATFYTIISFNQHFCSCHPRIGWKAWEISVLVIRILGLEGLQCARFQSFTVTTRSAIGSFNNFNIPSHIYTQLNIAG